MQDDTIEDHHRKHGSSHFQTMKNDTESTVLKVQKRKVSGISSTWFVGGSIYQYNREPRYHGNRASLYQDSPNCPRTIGGKEQRHNANLSNGDPQGRNEDSIEV
jgi:hypothetical protein